MEYYLEFNNATTKIVHDSKYKAKYIIHKSKDSLVLTDLEQKTLGKIEKLGSLLDTYEFLIPDEISGKFVVLSYFANNFIYIPKLTMLIGGNTKSFNFSIRQGTKKIATTSSVFLKYGPHISINIKDKNNEYLVILLIELFDQIGFINDKDKKRQINKKRKNKIAFNNFERQEKDEL